jgi:hypothetical protein
VSYNADGQQMTTIVDGSTLTGLHAADGSYNIVINTSTTPVGLFHPCGAYNAFVVTDPSAGYYAANGSVNVITRAGGTVLVSPNGNGNFT